MIYQENSYRKSESKTKRKTPAIGIFTKKQALLNISTTRISAFNIEEVEPTQTENAFIATINSIIPISFAVMHARGSQMCKPPQEQKEHQQQTIHAIQGTNMAGFPIPPTALAILKRGFYPEAEPILGNLPFPAF